MLYLDDSDGENDDNDKDNGDTDDDNDKYDDDDNDDNGHPSRRASPCPRWMHTADHRQEYVFFLKNTDIQISRYTDTQVHRCIYCTVHAQLTDRRKD